MYRVEWLAERSRWGKFNLDYYNQPQVLTHWYRLGFTK